MRNVKTKAPLQRRRKIWHRYSDHGLLGSYSRALKEISVQLSEAGKRMLSGP